MEAEDVSGKPEVYEAEKTIHRTQPKMADFLAHGVTEASPGCQAARSGTSGQGHSEACRSGSRRRSALPLTAMAV